LARPEDPPVIGGSRGAAGASAKDASLDAAGIAVELMANGIGPRVSNGTYLKSFAE